MAGALPVLDGDVCLDAGRLLRRLAGVHPDALVEAPPPWPVTPADAARVAGEAPEWAATPARGRRFMLLLGRLAPEHRDRGGDVPFAVLAKPSGCPTYARATAPASFFDGTLVDGDLVVGEGAAFDFVAHRLLALRGAPVPASPASANRAALAAAVALVTLHPFVETARPPALTVAPLVPPPPAGGWGASLTLTREHQNPAGDWAVPSRDVLAWSPPDGPVTLSLTRGRKALAPRVALAGAWRGEPGPWSCELVPDWGARTATAKPTALAPAPAVALSADQLVAVTLPLHLLPPRPP